MKIADVELAGNLEKILADVGKGKQNAGTFITIIEIFTKLITEEILLPNRTKGSKPGRKKKE